MHLQHLHLEFKEKVPPCDTDVEVVTNVEVVEEFFNVKVVELFVEAGQFGFVAGLLSRRGEAVRRGGAVRRVRVLQHRGGERVLQLRGGGGGVRLRRDQAAARMPRPSTFFKASRLKISLLYMFE